MKCNQILATVSAGTLLGCTQVPVSMAPIDPGSSVSARTMAPERVRSGASRMSRGGLVDLAELYREGRAAQEAGQLQQAAAAYARVLAIHPRHADALNALGVLRARDGQLQEALSLFDRAVEAEPRNAPVRNNRGYALLLAGRLDEAEADLQAALTLNASSSQTRGNLEQLAQAQAAAMARATGLEQAGRAQLVAVAPHVYELRDATAGGTSADRQPPVAAAMNRVQAPATLAGVRLEVSNGVGIRHLALRTARQLERLGLVPVRLSNQPGYRQQRTEIHYGAGYEQAAHDLSASLPLTPPARQVALDRKVPVRLVIGRDLIGRELAAWDAKPQTDVASETGETGWILG
jgi:tetratricopeptide (TPR) repeat protein